MTEFADARNALDDDTPVSAAGVGRWPWLARLTASLAALTASTVLTVALWAGTNHDVVGSAGFRVAGDDHVYLYMARIRPGAFHVAPWCWRVLIPLIVHYLPFSLQQGFACITLVTTALTGWSVYEVMRKLGFSNGLSMLGLVLFFSISYATRFNIRDFWLTDTTAFLFTALAVLALLYRRFMAYAMCLAAGVVAKESVVFVAPLCYTLTARRRWDDQALIRTVLLAVPAVGELALLRLLIPAWNGHAGYIATLPSNVKADIGNVFSYNLLTVAGKEISARWHVWPRELVEIITSFGALGLVLPLLAGWRSLRRVLQVSWPFLALVITQLLFTFNTQRLLVLAFIPVIWASLLGIHCAGERFDIPIWCFVVAVVASVVIEFASRTASAPQPTLQIATFGMITIMVLLYRQFRQRKGAEGISPTV
ncbi:MAG TPA: hypothetical protein VFQ44_17020 [Streptosporangiaceae bacterium]|nr:hypothetical protein [Streptosporangiaceae bacterium]